MDMIENDMMPPEGGQQVTLQQNIVPGRGANVGSVAIEQQRAVAEAQGKLILAKRFPRDPNAAFAEAMSACDQMSLAAVAFYAVPRGRSEVRGPSIRLAEELARCWGNMEYGHRELSRDGGKSEVEVYCWDMQNNNFARRQITVLHVIDTQQGPRKLRDQKDIDDKIANVASKQLRGRILALMPKWLVEAAQDRCRQTLEKGAASMPLAERIRRMTSSFAGIGVTAEQLAGYLDHKLDQTTPDEMITLTSIYNAITKDGAKASDYFETSKTPDAGAAINGILAGAATPSASTQPAPAAPPAANETQTAAASSPAPAPRNTRRVAVAAADKAAAPPPQPDAPPPPSPPPQPASSGPVDDGMPPESAAGQSGGVALF